MSQTKLGHRYHDIALASQLADEYFPKGISLDRGKFLVAMAIFMNKSRPVEVADGPAQEKALHHFLHNYFLDNPSSGPAKLARAITKHFRIQQRQNIFAKKQRMNGGSENV